MRSFVQAPFILFLAASVASATSNIKITSQGPESVTDVRDLKVTLTVTNTGKDTVNILREPNGALSKLPTDKFIIANEQNSQPEFNGIRAKYVPELAAKLGQYTTLKAGESFSAEHDLSAAYDLSTLGAGKYTIRPRANLYVVHSSGNIETISADTEDHVAKMAANSAKYSPRSTAKLSLLKKRSQEINFRGCTADQQSIVRVAAPNAVKMIRESSSYLGRTSSGTPRYTTWFGTYTSGRKNLVASHFSKIGNSPMSVTYDCVSCPPSNRDVFAYVHPNDPSTIYLCGAFWNAPETGTDSQAGTIVHESTHFTIYGGTQDYAYGQPTCQQLARSDPDKAVLNADSHEYFAENTPPLP